MQNLKNVELIVTQDGDVFTAKAHTYPAHGKGHSFREAIGDWVYINGRSGTNVIVGGPVFQPLTEVAPAAQQQ
jgi:hypothetical protein